MVLGYGSHRFHIARVTAKVDREDGASLGGNGRADGGGVGVVSAGIDVDEYRHEQLMQDAED